MKNFINKWSIDMQRTTYLHPLINKSVQAMY